MKKFILPIFCLAAGSVLANVGYIYKGSGALDDASSWYLITAGSIGNCNYAPLYPEDYTGEYTTKGDAGNYCVYTQATTAPTASDTVGFIRYEVGVIGENSSEITFSGEAKDYGDVVFGSSYSVGNIYSRSYWTRRLVLGSENATESEFVLKVTGNLNMFYSGNHSIVISDSAAQTSFKIDVGGQLMSQGITNGAIGAQGAYIDEVKAKSFAMTGPAAQTLNMYVKSMVIAETVEFGTSNVILHICELDPDSALFDIGGKFSKNAEKKVTLDFSELDLSSISSGTYDIISAGSLEGFSEDGTLADDFIVSGLDDENFSLAWNGNSLQMVVVPEPAAMASAIGAVCLILAGLRRKFRR